jgi:hypothetical protein
MPQHFGHYRGGGARVEQRPGPALAKTVGAELVGVHARRLQHFAAERNEVFVWHGASQVCVSGQPLVLPRPVDREAVDGEPRGVERGRQVLDVRWPVTQFG